MSGAILVYCAGYRTLAVPVGFGYFKCARCGACFRGIEDA